MKKLAVCFLVIFGLFLNIGNAGAENAGSLSLSPSVLELEANPGEKRKNSFEIINKGDFSIRLKPAIKNFRVTDEKGGIEFTDSDTGFSMAEWIIPEFTEFTIKSKETKKINFIISVPEGVETGSRFGAIVFEPAKKEQNLKSDFAFFIFLNINGKNSAEKKASISDFKTDFVHNQSPIKFSFRFENSGSVYLKPEGELTVYNLLGKEMSRAVLKNKIVYPSSTREFSSFWEKNYLSGIYKAKIKVSRGDGIEPFEAETYFIVFPWKFIVFSGFSILILIYFLKNYKGVISKKFSFKTKR